MAKITGQIPEQNFELIRDKIGVILVTELAAQTETQGFKVWSERVVPFNNSELPAINISFDNVPYDNHNPKSRTGENEYYIDVITKAKHQGNTEDQRGDIIASKKAQRVAGIIAYILSSGEYYTLDFPPGTIQSRWISEIKVGRIEDSDAIHTVLARVTFKVKANEYVDDLTGVAGKVFTAETRLEQTDKGFLYIIDNS